MIRPSTIFWLAIVAVLGLSLFSLKYGVQALEDDLTRVRRDTAMQQESLHVLRAEWTYLTQADRLVTLSAKFLTLTPLTSVQIATIDQLPLRPANAPPIVQPQPPPASLIAPGVVAPGAGTPVAGTQNLIATGAGPRRATPPAPVPARPAVPVSAAPAHSTAVAFHAAVPSVGRAP